MTVKIIETQSNFEDMTSLLEEAKDTLKHLTESEEWETLIQGSSADIVVENFTTPVTKRFGLTYAAL